MKNIVVLGSTGSIGASALDVIKRNPRSFRLVGLAANENHMLLAKQAREFGVKDIAINNKNHFHELKYLVPSDVRTHVGIDGVSRVASLEKADIVLMSIGGTMSLLPLIEAIKAKKTIALASKEALISAGGIVMETARKCGSTIIPVDSEHSAIFQCLSGKEASTLNKIYLTGSGGPLRTLKRASFDKLPFWRITKHPKWKMGKKITVDSATMMNKGLEVIEAKWLFSVPVDKVEILIHPEAMIHSMIEFIDGNIIANMFMPDMRLPILYALSYPERIACGLPKIDFVKLGRMTFEKPDFRKFPALGLAYRAGRSESASCVLNAANEEAVNAFLKRKIKFSSIIKFTEKVLAKHKEIKKPGLAEILELDMWARDETRNLCG